MLINRNNQIIPIGLLLIFIICLVFIVNFCSNWALGDDIQFLNTTAVGHLIKPTTGMGRFWPLGLFDFNILLLIPYGYTATAHYIYLSLWLLILCFTLIFSMLQIEKDYSKNINFIPILLVFLYVFLGTAMLKVFYSVIYPEKTIVTLLMVFLLLFYKYYKVKKKVYLICSIPIIIWITYCKEPTFAIFWTIAIMYLWFGRKENSKFENSYFAFLFINGLIFLILYFVLVLSKTTFFYNEGRGFSVSENLVAIFNTNPYLIILNLLVVLRLYCVFVKNDCKHLFYDSTLFAAESYFLAFVLLKLCFSHYFLPCLVLMIPSLFYWTIYLWQYNNKLCCLFVILAFALIMRTIHGFPYQVKNVIVSRKNDMELIRKAEPSVYGHVIIFFGEKPIKTTHLQEIQRWKQDVIKSFLAYSLNKGIEVQCIDSIPHVDNNYFYITKEYLETLSPNKANIIKHDYSRFVDFGGMGVYLYKRNISQTF
jgi:hypothetical protein